MNRLNRFLAILYLTVTLADLLLIYFSLDAYRWFSKPLLMPILILLIWNNKKQIPLFPWMIGGLILSWAGDVLLQMKNLFIPGLISFLLAHICYITYFIKINKERKGILQLQPLIGLPVVIYIILFLWLLFPFLDTMKIPVTIYSITIGMMLLMSINLQRKINNNASVLFFNGALQFVISDSILAVNLFAYHHVTLSICVMATYASAQYLLTKASRMVQESDV
jgi:uncharacterized membrane protein YhhN